VEEQNQQLNQRTAEKDMIWKQFKRDQGGKRYPLEPVVPGQGRKRVHLERVDPDQEEKGAIWNDIDPGQEEKGALWNELTRPGRKKVLFGTS